MLAQLSSTQFRRAAMFSAGLAVLWIVLAFIRSGTTFHLAPLLVAAIFPVMVTSDTEAPVTNQQLILATAGGLVVALLATLVLAVAGEMSGPSLLPFGGAVTESVIFAIAGSITGLVIGAWRRSG